MIGKLFLEDGSFYEGQGFGAVGTSVGELVFNTSMTGYEKMLTDPCYSGQVVTMTYPLVGNYGINGEESQSNKIYARGLVVRECCQEPSNYLCEKTLDQWLKEMGVPGISGVDTRKITKKIRNQGTMKCVITTENKSVTELKKICEETPIRGDLMKEASWAKGEDFAKKEGAFNVAVLDFGAKRSILESLEAFGCNLNIFPYGFTAEEVLTSNPDGVFLTNGPGDPQEAEEAIEAVKKLLQAKKADGKPLPMFGVCMGHQILALALGGEVYKLKYGHRGGNLGVYNLGMDKSVITSQNHGFAVKAESMLLKNMDITEVNLNDKTVEGMCHREKPVFSVQYQPEATPEYGDSKYLFEKFVDLMKM